MKEIIVVVVGSSGVGKSALTVQFVTDIFAEGYQPVIEDLYRKKIEVDQILEILDTDDQSSSVRDFYIKKGQVYVIIHNC